MLRWKREVHIPGIYDLALDTSVHDPAGCAAIIRDRLEQGPAPTALAQRASG